MFNKGDRHQETVVQFRPLHRSNLEDSPRFFNDLFDQLAFIDRQSERFFAIDVFSCVHRFDGDFRVPVVGRRDHHCINVLPVEDFAIILVGVGFPFLGLFRLLDIGTQHISVHIGKRREVGKLERLAGDRPALISKADGGEDRTVVGRVVPECSVCRRDERRCGTGRGNSLKKTSAALWGDSMTSKDPIGKKLCTKIGGTHAHIERG